jgi:hypothetical protein
MPAYATQANMLKESYELIRGTPMHLQIIPAMA